jgi:transcriptional regulator with XRE-family HTH domain
MNNASDIQVDFFKKLKQKKGADILLAEEVASALKISKSEAYNKISGKSALTLQQLQHLCTVYNVSFELNPNPKVDTCIVQYTPFHTGQISITQYLERMNNNMRGLVQAGVQKMSCATDDIPFYHMFKYPELAAFKLFYWQNRMGNNRKSGAEETFEARSINKKDIEAAFQLHKIYLNIPSVEIWTKPHLLIIMDQIRYVKESGLLKDKGLAEMICNQLEAVMDDVELFAIQRSKSATENISFDWYHCDVVGNVAYLAETGTKNFCFLRFNTFNHFQTDNEALTREVRLWLDSLLNDATGFSGQGSKHRNVYLQKTRQACKELKELF